MLLKNSALYCLREVFVQVTNGLILKSESICPNIVLLSNFVVSFPILRFIILTLKMILFLFGVLEMPIMFVMVERVIVDEVDCRIRQIPKVRVEEDEQTISLEKLEICAEKQPVDSQKQPVDSQKQPIEILQQSELPKEWRIPRDLSVDNIIGQIKEGVSTRSSVSNYCRHTAFVSQIEPKSIEEALKDEKWVEAMHEELNQGNEVWFLVPKTNEMNIIGSKWVFRNKLDEDGVITSDPADNSNVEESLCSTLCPAYATVFSANHPQNLLLDLQT